MCNGLSKMHVKIAIVAVLLMWSTLAKADSRCEFIGNLEKFQTNAEILAMSNITHNSEQIQSAKRNIHGLFRLVNSKNATLDMASIYPDRADWLGNYLILWVNFEGAYNIGGWQAASQLLSSGRYRQSKSELTDIKQRLGCAGANPETTIGLLSKLNIKSLSHAMGLSNSGFEQGVTSVMAVVILALVLVVCSVIFWSIFRYEAYRKDCAKRYNCDVKILTKGKFGEVSEKILNISRSGACIVTENKYSPGEAVWVQLEQKWLKTKVAWIGGPKVGLEFRFNLRRIPSFATKNQTIRLDS